MTIDLCLFNLDDTLLRTGDLEPFRGQNHLGVQRPEYDTALHAAFDRNPLRHLYSPADLVALRTQFPTTKWGVFTRSPRHYTRALLHRGYPGVQWDAAVAFEDVKNTKPYGDGIWAAMDACGLDDLSRVALVGDNTVDILAAYRGGCWGDCVGSSIQSDACPERPSVILTLQRRDCATNYSSGTPRQLAANSPRTTP